MTVAVGLMVNTIASLVAGQGPAGSFEVMVSVIVPEVISAAEGVYTAFTNVALLNVPVPDVVQVDEVAPPLLVPDNV